MTKRILMAYGLILAGIAMTIWLWSVGSAADRRARPVRYQIAVVVNDSTNSRWSRFQAGIEKAADDYDISLNYLVTGKFDDIREELALINNTASSSDGLIVQLVDSSAEGDLIRDISRTTVLELIGTGEVFVQEEESCGGIFADNHAIGASLAEVILRDYEEKSELRIGIVSGNQNMDSMQERLSSFEAVMKEHNVVPVWIMNSILPERTSLFSGVDVIAVLDNENLEAAADSLRTSEKTGLYGIGCSDKTIYYLDRGVISAMIVPDDFQMGYLAIMDVYNHLRTPNVPMHNREVSFEVITKENLYSPKHEAMLFPIIG